MSQVSSAGRRRLAIVVSHPIQHFVPLYRALAATADIELRVFFASRIGLQSYYDPEMKTQIAWSMDMLSGYDHVFLPGADAITTVDFRSINSPGLAAALDAFGPDAVMIYGYAQANALRAIHWARRNRRNAMMISDSELRRPRTGLLGRIKAAMIPQIYARIDNFLSVGDCNEAYYRHYGVPADRIFRSPFTIDEERYRAQLTQKDAARAALRGELGLADDAILALFVGKLSPRKRPADLLAAVTRLRDAGGPLVHAVFAGNGEEMAAMQAAATRGGAPAHFLGFVNVDRLPSIYAGCDMLVHPSEADPHPLICSEAACLGLPMLLSDRIGAEGPTDIARAGDNALIFPVADVDALSARIAELAGDPAKRAHMSARSLAIFDELDVQRSIDGIRRAMIAGLRGRRG